MIIKTINKHTDAELLFLWEQGDESAFSIIYHRYVLDLLAIALDKTRDRAVAEELVQDAFMVLYNKHSSIGEINNLMAFLYVVLKNKILDWYRKKAHQKKLMEYVKINFDTADNTTQAIIDTKDLERILQSEIEKLPEQCKKVFLFRRNEFMPNKEIALRMEISENTVEQHMRRALRLLRSSISHFDLLLWYAMAAGPFIFEYDKFISF